MRKRRVALVSLHWAEYAVNLALALAERSEVLLILYRDDADNELGTGWQDRLRHPALSFLVVDRPTSLFAVLKNARLLVHAIRRFRPEIIHYQEACRDELFAALLFLRTTPTVLTVHDPTIHSGTDARTYRFSRVRLYRLFLRAAADVAITHGRALAEQLVQESPRLKGRVRVVPHGPLSTVRQDTTLRAKDWRLLFFGRMYEYKGLRYFVDAVIALRAKGYPVTGVVAGQGPDLDRLRRRMKASGCFDILDQYIPAADVPHLFLSSLAIVLPYTEATQSGVAAMALGCGRPVIASAVGSVPELVRHGVNGLLVPPCDVEALTKATESVITDDQLWSTLAAGAAKLRDGELSWKAIGDETIRVYDSLLGRD